MSRRPVAVLAGPLGVWPPGLEALAAQDPRWTWPAARDVVPRLPLRPRTCWDLGAVGRLLHGLRRDDLNAVWAAAHDLPLPAPLGQTSELFDVEGEDGSPVRPDGHLSRELLREGTPEVLAGVLLQLQARQEEQLRALPDPRAAPVGAPLALSTAHAESAAALLAAELERDGLPVDRSVVSSSLTALLGPRPVDAAQEAEQRSRRDAAALARFPGGPVDLRSPAQVQELLCRVGLDLPDTRSWRLEPHAATVPAVADLLAWRKAERTATTYGWGWLDRSVGADGRLRGPWRAADGASGRMTAGAGLHNLPAELRPAVRAEPGCVLVRADLGQVEPRVLAAVSGDAGLAAAAGEADLYAPVAAALRCDRPTAKIAVLAAMYGQTTGTAGAALRDLDRAYPTAMAYLRAAEEAGRTGAPLRTWGGRLLPTGTGGHGRFARNAVVQGAAAELFKAWAATVRDGLHGLGGSVVLCLHDELLLQVPVAAEAGARQLLVDALDATAHWWAAGSGVRFVAEVGAGPSWADAKA